MGRGESARPDRARALVAILSLAFALRVAVAMWLPNVAHPDETFQYLEPAYRIVAGRGLVPWEYEVGARSWLLPWALVPPAALATALGDSPVLLRLIVAAFASAISLVAVWSAWRIGRATASRGAGLFAAFLVAIWCELVYASPHILADTVSAVFLIGGVAAFVDGAGPDRRRLAAMGLWFGVALILRPQLAPACAVAGLWAAGLRPSPKWAWIIAGMAPPLLMLGLGDWIAWGRPFHSVVTYIHVNSSGIADLFGIEPPGWYLRGEARIWYWAAPLVLVTAIRGGLKAPIAAATMLAVIAFFSAVPHKEWRFVFPALPLLFALCGIGTMEFSRAAAGKLGLRAPVVALPAAALWALLSLLAGSGAAMRPLWLEGSVWVKALDRVSADPRICGVGLDPANRWSSTGMARLRRDIRLLDGETEAPDRFNTLLLFNRGSPETWGRDPRFAREACFDAKLCLYRRPGGCAAGGRDLSADPGADVAAKLGELGFTDAGGYRPLRPGTAPARPAPLPSTDNRR